MLEFQTQPPSEERLAALLGELLEGEEADAAGTTGADVPAEIAEMRDMARLLRAASQSVPLPEGRLAVRRALLATLPTSSLERTPVRAAWRRTGRWLGLAAALGMIVAAFGLGAGLLDSIGSSNPLYGLRRAVDKVRVAFVPGRPEGGQSPFVSYQPGSPETGGIPPSGIARTPGISGYPLSIEFRGVAIPTAPGQEVTVRGTVGGLPVTLSLTATTGCPAGKACGDFEAWVTPLRGTRASAEFGQMRGTFICAPGECTLTPVSTTGVFDTTSAFLLQRNASGQLAGLVGTGFDSLGDWVAAVAQVAEKLRGEDLLPPGITVKQLVEDATKNKSVPNPSPQGMPGRSAPSGIANMPDAGVPTGTSAPGITMGTGMGSSPTLGGGGFSGLPGTPGVPGGTSTGTTISPSLPGSGTTVTTSGTATVSTSTPSVSTSTPSGTPSGSVSVSTSTSGTTNTSGGSVSGSTSTNSGSVSGSGSASGSAGGGSASGSASASGGTSTGGGTPSGSGTVGGGTSSGGGVGVGVGGIGVSIGGGGVSVGAGGAGSGGAGGGGALGGTR